MAIRAYMMWEHELARWFLGFKTTSLPNYLKIVAKELYPEEIKVLRGKKCPFCGRKFTRRSSLFKHLNMSHRSRCSECFYMIIDYVLETYRRIHYMIRRIKKGKYVVGDKVFRTRKEAIMYILREMKTY